MIQTNILLAASLLFLSRNPVFALEMIQTQRRRGGQVELSRGSQSSIRPGDDSDNSLRKESPMSKSRNPVFALEMIQTKKNNAQYKQRQKRRNPVFALEMIQTHGCPLSA